MTYKPIKSDFRRYRAYIDRCSKYWGIPNNPNSQVSASIQDEDDLRSKRTKPERDVYTYICKYTKCHNEIPLGYEITGSIRCYECHQEEIKDDFKEDKFLKNCPKCGDEQEYADKYIYKAAIENNIPCSKCGNRYKRK